MQLIRGSRIVIVGSRMHGSISGTVLTAHNYGSDTNPDWYIELDADVIGYAYYKQSADGGSVSLMLEPEPEPVSDPEENTIMFAYDKINFDVSRLDCLHIALVKGSAAARIYVPIKPSAVKLLDRLEAEAGYRFVEFGATKDSRIGYWVKDLDSMPLGELAELADIGTYDSALPQNWVDEYRREHDRHPVGVWVYPEGSIFGRYMPRAEIVNRAAGHVYDWCRDNLSIAAVVPLPWGMTFDAQGAAIEDRKQLISRLGGDKFDYLNPSDPEDCVIVSSGTLFETDLIEAFWHALSNLAPRAAARLIDEYFDAYCWLFCHPEDPNLQWTHERYYSLEDWQRDQLAYFLEAITESIEAALPEDYYFGTSEGDGALFGVWRVDPEAEAF